MKNKYKIILSFTAILLILFPQVSLAQESKQGLKGAFGSGSPLADVQTRTGYSDEDIGTVSGRVINTALTLVGIIFLLLMVYAGYLWMTAQGEDAQIKKATDIIKGTVIGLVLVLSAYAITIFVTKGLNPAPAPPAPATPVPVTASCKDKTTAISGCPPTPSCNGRNSSTCGSSICCDWK